MTPDHEESITELGHRRASIGERQRDNKIREIVKALTRARWDAGLTVEQVAAIAGWRRSAMTTY